MFYLYFLRNQYNDLYIGITDNPTRRLLEHNTHRGSHFTKARSIFEIVFLEEYQTLSDARKREIQVKKWNRHKKDTLIKRYKDGLNTYM
jgi:putative endonuclease